MAKYYVDEVPSWMKETSEEEYDEDFVKIIDFFQFHSPVPGLAARCKTIQEYGWENPWKKPFWLNKQLKQASANFELLFTTETQGKVDENLEKADLKDFFPNDLSRERICVVNNKKNQFMSVFYHIRDAFAYGRFYIENFLGEKVFVMEDVSPGGLRRSVTARMIIRKSTLLAWISIIKLGEKHYVRDGDMR